jgi:hypothetical protein
VQEGRETVRVTIALIVLLVVATTSVSYVWRSLSGFADAAALAQVMVLVGAVTATISSAMLARIVMKVSAAKQ